MRHTQIHKGKKLELINMFESCNLYFLSKIALEVSTDLVTMRFADKIL